MPAEGAVTTTILVLSGGGPAPTTPLPSPDLVIAADSGYALADGLGIDVDLVVGDLDSIEATDLVSAESDGVPVHAHPADKDATDLELALLAAVERGADRIVVAGGGAGRLDHLLGVAMLLGDDRWAGVAIEWHAGTEVAHVVRDNMLLDVEPGDIVSLVPIIDCEVSITGTRWALDHERLRRGTTRGVSNEATDDTVTVIAHAGVVFAVTTRGDTT
jgi:thiamine pyrophosphokinase